MCVKESTLQGVPKKAESNFKVRLFNDDLIVWSDLYFINIQNTFMRMKNHT